MKREQSTTKYAIRFGRDKLMCHLLLNDDIHYMYFAKSAHLPYLEKKKKLYVTIMLV